MNITFAKPVEAARTFLEMSRFEYNVKFRELILESSDTDKSFSSYEWVYCLDNLISSQSEVFIFEWYGRTPISKSRDVLIYCFIKQVQDQDIKVRLRFYCRETKFITQYKRIQVLKNLEHNNYENFTMR
eukprot:snap_masked-scaffold_54-processed-gene-1.57-mRNA-1 protein AED:1.00 eAED:1.00 QI:0/-1/0/0/-1/1/1/0/128